MLLSLLHLDIKHTQKSAQKTRLRCVVRAEGIRKTGLKIARKWRSGVRTLAATRHFSLLRCGFHLGSEPRRKTQSDEAYNSLNSTTVREAESVQQNVSWNPPVLEEKTPFVQARCSTPAFISSLLAFPSGNGHRGEERRGLQKGAGGMVTRRPPLPPQEKKRKRKFRTLTSSDRHLFQSTCFSEK